MARADRPAPGDEPGVDFVVGAPDGGPDEQADELLAPPDDRRERTRRLRVEIALGSLGLLVVVLIGRAALKPGSTAHADRTATPASPTDTLQQPAPTGPVTPPPYLYRGHLPPTPATTTATPHPAYPKRIPQRRGTVPAACPGLRCSTSTTLPNPVSEAIQEAFPESTVERAETVRLRGGGRVLWYREVDVRVGTQQLTLRVQAPAKGDRTASGHRTSNGQQTTYVSTSLGPWHVEVDVLDLLGGQAPTDRLTALAHDPRIVAA